MRPQTMTKVNDFWAKLTLLERQLFLGLEDVPQEWLGRVSLSETGGFLSLDVTGTGCPFFIGVGREENANRVNFYVGEGAEYSCCEELSDESAPELAVDFGEFLRSEVALQVKNGLFGGRSVVYTIVQSTVDGVPVEFWTSWDKHYKGPVPQSDELFPAWIG